MKFCTAINCMDGRVQLPVIEFLKERFDIDVVDTITEPGPCLLLAARRKAAAVKSVFSRLDISVHHHHSVGVAIVAHHDCAGNPAPKAEQLEHLRQAVGFVAGRVPGLPVIGLWVDEDWAVEEAIPASAR